MSSNTHTAETTFLACGERIVGYCLNQPGAIADLRGRLPDGLMFPRRPLRELGNCSLAAVWGALLQQTDAGSSMSPETVADAARADPYALIKYANNEAYTQPADIEELVGILVKHGKRAAKRRIGVALQSEDPGKQLSEGEAIAQLDAIERYGMARRDTSMAANVRNFREEKYALPSKANPTGIPAMDVALWEMPVGESTIIAAQYKGQKSRISRNLTLATACRGAKTFVVLAEGWSDEFTRDCIAMVSAAYIRYIGRWDDPLNRRKITGRYLARSRAYLKNPLHNEAVTVAESILEQLDITVWDSRDGAKNPYAIMGEARHLVRNGTTLMMLDYVQNVAWPGSTLYEQMTFARGWLSEARSIAKGAKDTGLHVLLLSQMNELSIREKGKNAGILGGGNLAYEVDNMLAPEYNSKERPGIISIPLRFSRANPSLDMDFEQEVTSGLLTKYLETTDTGVTATPVDIIPRELLAQYGQTNFKDDMTLD